MNSPNPISPPRWPWRLLRRVLNPNYWEELRSTKGEWIQYNVDVCAMNRNTWLSAGMAKEHYIMSGSKGETKKMLMKTLVCLVILVLLSNCKSKNGIVGNEEDQSIEKATESRKSGFEMVDVLGGYFVMGGHDDVDDGGSPEMRIADECAHDVTVEGFSIGRYEVTQADWFKVMGTRPPDFNDCQACPVAKVSWDEIQVFINRLNSIRGQTYRLPTEEEWEFAARGGLKSKGYQYSGSHNATEVAWFTDNAGNGPRPVGLLRPNELGLYDMSGNIWEWCSDAKVPYPCDHIGKVFDSKILRGGSFSHRVSSVRVRDRNARDPATRLPTLGFRLARDL